MKKTILYTAKAPAAIGPYSQGTALGDLVFLSGQLGFDPTGALPQGAEAQARCAMENIGAILQSQGMGYENILKTTIFLTDLGQFGPVNEVYASFFSGDYPARSCVQVAALPKGGVVEIEVIAAKG